MKIIVAIIIVFAVLAWMLYLKLTESSGGGGYLDVPTNTEVEVPTKQFNPKKIEGIITCVGYADFLRWTLPFNRQHFDRLVVVTTPEDTETQEVCEFWHVECIQTSVFNEGGGFNKGKGINVGLNALDKDGWVMHLDGDIWLPPRTKDVLNLLPLDPETLYGIDRLNCYGLENFIKYLQAPLPFHGNDGFLRLKQFPLGSRLMNLDRDGYVPVGYFQLFCPIGSGVSTYPDFHTGADRTDTLFVYNWDRQHRQLIPELVAIHLESQEDLPMGINWRGRQSKRFEI